MEPFEMKFKIYMEAEDIGQSRIHTSIAFLKTALKIPATVTCMGLTMTMRQTRTHLYCGFMQKRRSGKRIALLVRMLSIL